ncbi:zf-TFIIB domain-containing protein [Sporosarcina sp. 6E9]|uniref:TFIIB-type zinc ribbon-containing protein n=1 Tax=Sporosarcina sp. 6E9 TaxID=2819235 RepID=UPI001ACEB4D4|nr:zf-TFIIB domain-containing protein [Sporosarcina sp. 6E9]MBO1910373.1 zf-TFIIB domain-containing protein [Microvirga sp. 3-52]
MLCPTCVDMKLQEIKKGSVLIDVCPACKGIWLDRGELEMIVRELKKEHTNKSKGQSSKDKDKKETTMLDILSDLIVFW